MAKQRHRGHKYGQDGNGDRNRNQERILSVLVMRFWQFDTLGHCHTLLCELGCRLSRHSLEGISRGRDRMRYVSRSVRCGDKRSFKLRRSKEHAAIEHLTEKPCISFCIRSFCIAVVAHRLRCEKQCRQRLPGVHLPGNRTLLQRLAQPLDQPVRLLVDAFVQSWPRELLEG